MLNIFLTSTSRMIVQDLRMIKTILPNSDGKGSTIGSKTSQ